MQHYKNFKAHFIKVQATANYTVYDCSTVVRYEKFLKRKEKIAKKAENNESNDPVH